MTTGTVVPPMAAPPGRRRPGRPVAAAVGTLLPNGLAGRGLRSVCGLRHDHFRVRQRRAELAEQLSEPLVAGSHSVCRHQSARRGHLRSLVRGRQPAPRDVHDAEPGRTRRGAAVQRLHGLGKRDHRRSQRLGGYRLRPGRGNRCLSHSVLVGRRRLSQSEHSESRLPPSQLGTAERHPACAVELQLFGLRPAGCGSGASVSRQPGHRHLRRGQCRHHTGHVDEFEVLRRLRRRRRRHPLAPSGVLLLLASRRIPRPRLTRLFINGTGLSGAATEIGATSYPPGNLRRFEHLESILNFGPDDYIIATATGVFVTLNVGASPIVWTPLGATNTPANACGVSVAFTAGAPTFFVKSGGCDGDAPGTLWRHQGTAAGGTWQQVPNPAVGSFGIYAVDRNNPQRLIASNLGRGYTEDGDDAEWRHHLERASGPGPGHDRRWNLRVHEPESDRP